MACSYVSESYLAGSDRRPGESSLCRLHLSMLNPETPFCRIWFVRHGQTEFNRLGRPQGQLDIPLNDCGVGQAELCGERFKKVKLDLILSSDLERAYKACPIYTTVQNEQP